MKLGNSGMSNNAIMNETERPRGADIPRRGLACRQVRLSVLDVSTVPSRRYIGCLVSDCPRYPWFCWFLLPAWTPVELCLPSPPLWLCRICLRNSYVLFKTQLKSIFLSGKPRSPPAQNYLHSLFSS